MTVRTDGARLLGRDARAGAGAATLLDRLDVERSKISKRLAADPERRAALGQFFTPAGVARFMAAMLRVSAPPPEFRLLDAGGGSGRVRITTSHGPADEGLAERTIEQTELILPGDPACVLHVVPDGIDARIAERMRALPHTLASHGIAVSTGRVVGFRAQDRLRADAGAGDAPLIMSRHFEQGFVAWPRRAGSKPNALAVSGPGDALLLPAGWYVLVRRFSAKEEKRRVVAALYDPERVDAEAVAFDNKLNVLHGGNAGLPAALARGLAVFLNSTAVDACFRQFSGHTQVNAEDLRSLRFPAAGALQRLGRHVSRSMPTQDEIDGLVREEIFAMSEAEDPVAVKRRVQAAEGVLRAMGASRAQCNERSALTLLGLLDIAPLTPWSDAGAPLRGVTELMRWMAENYGKQYAPNTRETIRRFTLHQLIEMGMVVLNPDDPARAPNSPRNVYRIAPEALELLRRFGTEAWDRGLAAYTGAGSIARPVAAFDRIRAPPGAAAVPPGGGRFGVDCHPSVPGGEARRGRFGRQWRAGSWLAT